MNLQPLREAYLADPFVLRVETSDGPMFYATGGGSTVGDVREGAYQFPLLRSRDLKSWEELGGALIPAPHLQRASHWAPEMCERDGTFYLYYSAQSYGEGARADEETQRLRVATSEKPEGPFRDQGALFRGDLDFGFCIDADPFRDPFSGEWFLYFSRDRLDDEHPGTGNAVVRLGEHMRPIGEIYAAVLPSGDWQAYERNRSMYGRTFPTWHTVEGACVIYRQNRYYHLYSGGNYNNETYGVSFATADNPLGPWQESGRRVMKSGDFGLRGPGHNSLVVGPDERDYIVFHAWNADFSKRQMHIAPLRWAEDGPHLDVK